MKTFKIILLSTISIFAVILLAIYLAFLFVLPNSIDLNQYSPQITQEIEKATGFQVQIKGLKVKTAWNLSGGALIDRTDLKYPKSFNNGEKFAQINGLEVKLSLLPLFFGQIRIDSVDLDKIIMNLKVQKSGKFLIEQCLPKNLGQKPVSVDKVPFPLQFSPDMPTIRVKKYKVSFIDIPTGKSYAIKGINLDVSDFVLEKKIKVNAKGDLILDGRKQIAYDLSVFSKILPVFDSKKPPEFNFIGVFKDLYKYNMKANIKSDLKISGKPEDVNVDGNIDLDKVSFTIGGKTLPQSNLELKFKGDKVKINSDFYTAVDKRASITGVFDNGRKKSIDLKVSSRKTDIGNTFLIANNILQMFGNKNLNGISADGVLSADFKVKSDFKKVQSSGFLKVNNANITDKLHNVSLKSICADIDFSQNAVHIIKSSAKLGSEPILVKGTINADANADLSVFAENLQLKGLLATLGKMQILNENDIQSGLISVKASIKGRLDKAMPTIDATVSNVSLKNKPNNVLVKISGAKVKAVSNGKKTKGSAELVGLKLFPSNGIKAVTLPKASLNFDEKDLAINNSSLYLNNSKIAVFGKIKDYSTEKPKADITAHGLMYASDIKSLLPKSNQAGVLAAGKIPLIVRITGNGKYDINAQMLANKSNHLTVFDINTLRGKTSLINAQLTLIGNDLNIREIALYAFKSNKGLSQNMRANLANGTKVAFVIGKVSDINTSNPKFKDVGISVPNQVTTSIPGYVGSNAHIKGDLSIDGTFKNPDVKGYLTIPSVYIPTMKTNLRNLVVHFNKNTINLNCPEAMVADSIMEFNTVILNNFSKGIIAKTVDIDATNINLDSLSAVLAKLPQNANGPGVSLGATILSGKSEISRFKTGNIIATNVSSDISMKNNLLKMSNLRADSYLGKIGGTITYNLVYNNIGLNLQGRNLSAGPAIKALTGRPDVAGQLDFDSKISMTGGSREQLLRTLKGNNNFIISNGKMGSLGKLEHLLYAQNIVSNSVLGTSLNVIARAVMVKNTGYYKYIKGKMTFSNGWSNISYIKTSGPSMSMYITGRFNLLNNTANLVILGRISNDVVRILGPLGDLSMDKMLLSIPKIGTITSILLNQVTTNPVYENVSMIPPLTPKTEMPTKEFKVILDGGIDSQSSVKSFKWLSNPKLPAEKVAPRTYPQVGQAVKSISKNVQEGAKDAWQQVAPIKTPGNFSQTYPNYHPPVAKPTPNVPDFVKSLPDLK